MSDAPEERAAAELYALPPEEFVEARDRMAARLKAEGEREAAERVRKLRRPTVAAWAVNQLVRRDADAVGRLLAAGERVREAQRELLSGGAEARRELRDATLARREALAALAQRTERILADAGREGGAHLQAVTATLDAASLDEEGAKTVRSGRLTKELAPAAGFGDAAALLAEPAPAPAARARTRRASEAERERERRRAAREEVAALGAVAEQARAEADRAGREAREAAREVERLEAELRSARRRAQRAEARADDARTSAEEAERAVEEARRALD